MARPLRHRLALTLAVLVIAALLSGCGSDTTGPAADVASGTFVATISGDISASFNGPASYAVGEFQDGSGSYLHDFTLVSLEGASAFLASARMCRPNVELPSGGYPLADRWEWRPFDEFGLDFGFVLPDGREGEVDTWSGTITITRTGDGRVTGSIQGSGSALVETGTTEISVTVSLTAEFDPHPTGLWEVPSQLSCPPPW